MIKRVLITGGAGFIGSHLVRRVLDDGCEVVVLDDLSSGKRENVPEPARLVIGTVLDRERLAEAMSGVDACVHLAAIASVAKCSDDLISSHQVNLTGWLNVVDVARRCANPPRLVYASSAAVYGANQDVPLDERATASPLSAYGADKYACELHARAAMSVYGLPSRGLRFFNVYGPGQDPSSPYSGVISRFASRLLGGRAIEVHGSGAQSRDFVYVADIVEALVRAASTSAGGASVLNVCTGAEVTVLELAKLMSEVFDQEARIEFSAPRPGDIPRSLGDPRNLQRELGFSPSWPLGVGLRRLRDSLTTS